MSNTIKTDPELFSKIKRSGMIYTLLGFATFSSIVFLLTTILRTDFAPIKYRDYEINSFHTVLLPIALLSLFYTVYGIFLLYKSTSQDYSFLKTYQLVSSRNKDRSFWSKVAWSFEVLIFTSGITYLYTASTSHDMGSLVIGVYAFFTACAHVFIVFLAYLYHKTHPTKRGPGSKIKFLDLKVRGIILNLGRRWFIILIYFFIIILFSVNFNIKSWIEYNNEIDQADAMVHDINSKLSTISLEGTDLVLREVIDKYSYDSYGRVNYTPSGIRNWKFWFNKHYANGVVDVEKINKEIGVIHYGDSPIEVYRLRNIVSAQLLVKQLSTCTENPYLLELSYSGPSTTSPYSKIIYLAADSAIYGIRHFSELSSLETIKMDHSQFLSDELPIEVRGDSLLVCEKEFDSYFTESFISAAGEFVLSPVFGCSEKYKNTDELCPLMLSSKEDLTNNGRDLLLQKLAEVGVEIDPWKVTRCTDKGPNGECYDYERGPE